MQKYSELNDESKKTVFDVVDRRWKQLIDTQNEREDDVVRYSFLINSGGAIATFSFIGTNSHANLVGAKFSLLIFISGILIIGGWKGLLHNFAENSRLNGNQN